MYLLILSLGFLFIPVVELIITPPEEHSVEAFVKMSERQTHFVLDTWLVEQAWVNPSMVYHPEEDFKVVMVWRMPDKGRHDKIGYMWMDSRDWSITKNKDMIELMNTEGRRWNLIGEDSRIFNHNGKLFIIYNNHLEKFKRVFYAEVFYKSENDMFYAMEPPTHLIFEGEKNMRHQKNWTPFDFCPKCIVERGSVIPKKSEGNTPELLFIYRIQPHIIVKAQKTSIPGEESVTTVFVTKMQQEFEWQWGGMRGGSPALLINEDQYLTFFHSSGRLTHKNVISYVMGAYLFSSKPPFAITHVSPEPITHQAFVNESYGWAYKIVDFIVFPMGFTFDDKYIYVSYGKNDKNSWLVKLDKKGLLDSLISVQTTTLGVSVWDRDTGKILIDSYLQFQSYDVHH